MNSLIVFLLTAAVVYFMFVAPMNKFKQRRARGQVAAADPTELELLAEIRDALKTRS